MEPDEVNQPELLAGARDRCRRLVGELRRDASALEQPSRLVSARALAEGRAAYQRAAGAAEALLRRLDEAFGATAEVTLETSPRTPVDETPGFIRPQPE